MDRNRADRAQGPPVWAACMLSRVRLFGDAWDWSPPGFSVHGIFQVIILEWPFPPPGDLPDAGIEPASPESSILQMDILPLSHWGSKLHSQGLNPETVRVGWCSGITQPTEGSRPLGGCL